MATTTNVTIRMDSQLKTQAEALFSELGLNLSTAFGIFVRQAVREGRILLLFLLISLTRKLLQLCWKQKELLKILLLKDILI